MGNCEYSSIFKSKWFIGGIICLVYVSENAHSHVPIVYQFSKLDNFFLGGLEASQNKRCLPLHKYTQLNYPLMM